MRFHDLRHTAAMHMLINGVDILTVAKRLGHSKTSVTLDTYGHLIPGVQEKAAYIMDEITTPVTLFTRETAPKLHQE
jgi:integrase